MRPCEVATTVFGRSTTIRAGLSSVLSCGFTAPRALISTLTPSSVRTTFTLLQCGVLRSVRARALRLSRCGNEHHYQQRQ